MTAWTIKIILVEPRGLWSSYLQAIIDSYEVMGCSSNKEIIVAKRANEMHQGLIGGPSKTPTPHEWQHTRKQTLHH